MDDTAVEDRMDADVAAGAPKRPIEDTLAEETLAAALPKILAECTNLAAPGAASQALEAVFSQALSSTPEQARGNRQYNGLGAENVAPGRGDAAPGAANNNTTDAPQGTPDAQ